MADIKEILIKKYTEFEKSLNGQTGTPIHDARKLAIKSFENTGLPGAKSEEYKYTHLGRLLTKNIDFGAADAHVSELDEKTIKGFHFPHDEANVLYFVNGAFKKELSKIISAPEELELKDIATAFKENADLLFQHFGKHINHKDPFAALNTAFSNHGVFIRIAKNKALSHPVIIYNITDASVENTVYHPRNFILAEENSQAHIIETYQTFGAGKNFVNQAGEIIVEKAANLAYYKLQEDSDESYRTDNTQVIQYRDSVFNAFTFTFSGKVVRNNLSIKLADEHCESHMFGLYLLKGTSHVDNHTVVDHEKANAFSNEIYKGILDEKSTGVFNGKIYVRQDAQKTNAFQSNKNILLTDEASINTKPQLEIWADDVKCSHGCTTGQLDDDQMFYLRARGIEKESARALLLLAFAADVLENINVEFLLEHLGGMIHERLSK